MHISIYNTPQILRVLASRLESYKSDCIDSKNLRPGNYWELSNAILGRIEGPSYVDNKKAHNVYLRNNPHVAKMKFININ